MYKKDCRCKCMHLIGDMYDMYTDIVHMIVWVVDTICQTCYIHVHMRKQDISITHIHTHTRTLYARRYW